ncbi:synaptic vesicle-associated integral membrane protein, putative, partial [Ixodes scapularis]
SQPGAAGGAGAAEQEGGPKPPNPQHQAASKRIQQTQAQVDEVVDIMRTNVEKVLERDQKLSELDDRADALQQGASQFEQQAGKLKRKFWWKNCKARDVGNLNCCHCGHNHYHCCLGCQWLEAHVGEDFCGRPARHAPPAPGRRTRKGPRRLAGEFRAAQGDRCGRLQVERRTEASGVLHCSLETLANCGLSVRSHNRGSPSSRRCR